VHSVLERIRQDQIDVNYPELESAFQIARLIRNAFAHNPLIPTWEIRESFQNKTYVVPNVISLSTVGLDGKFLKRSDYGGPLSVLRLIEFAAEAVNRAYRGAAQLSR
jgi:hypothetical protein